MKGQHKGGELWWGPGSRGGGARIRMEAARKADASVKEGGGRKEGLRELEKGAKGQGEGAESRWSK